MFKNLKKSKTIKMQAALFLAGAFAIIADNLHFFESSLSQTHYGLLFMGVSLINYYLRTITRQPLEDK